MKNLKNTSQSFFKHSWPFLAILFIVFSFFWRIFVYNEVPLPGDFIVGVYYPWLDYKWGYPAGVPVKNPITTDVVSFSFPMRSLVINLIKSRTLPLWNPYILNGTPLLANFQSAVFSPTNIVYFIFDKLTAWSLQVILQYVFAILFTYLLLRYWKVSRGGAIFGGIIFAFGGFNLIWGEWNAHTLAASFIPLLILFADKYLCSLSFRNKLWTGFALSATLALQFFSGYPQVVFYSFIVLGILWVFRIQKVKKKLFTTILLGTFVIFGICLAAIQILPGAELLLHSQRAIEAHPFDWAFLPWSKVITFIASDYFGNHATYNYWGPQDYTSNTGFIGITATTLALYAIFNWKKNKAVWLPFVITITALVLSFPTPISIFLWKSGVFGFNAAAAHRALVIFVLGISLLAGFGLDILVVSRRKILSFVFAFLPSVLLIILFGTYALQIHQNVGLKNLILPFGVLFFTFLLFTFKPSFKIGFIFLALVELFYFGWKFTPFSQRNFIFPNTPIISFLKSQVKPFRTTGDHVIPINFRMAYGIEAVEGYDAIYPAIASSFIQEVNGGGEFRRYAIIDNETSPLLDLANTKYYLALKNDPDLKKFDSKRFKLIFSDKSVDVFESKTVLPRAFMVYDWEVDTSTKETDLTLFEKNFQLGKKILLDSNVPIIPQTNLKNLPRNSVNYTTYQNQQSLIKVNTASDGILFVSDSYYPGWKAFVDGIETKITRSDFAFRAIVVPKGEHEIKMIYEPESFYNGLNISLGSFVFLIGFGIIYELYLKKFI